MHRRSRRGQCRARRGISLKRLLAKVVLWSSQNGPVCLLAPQKWAPPPKKRRVLRQGGGGRAQDGAGEGGAVAQGTAARGEGDARSRGDGDVGGDSDLPQPGVKRGHHDTVRGSNHDKEKGPRQESKGS